MGAAAARAALDAAGVGPPTSTPLSSPPPRPTRPFPSTAVHVQAALGANEAFGFDISAACSGFIYAPRSPTA